MKINGSDELIRLLLEIKVNEGGKNPDIPSNVDKLTQKVEEIAIRKEEFILKDNWSNTKSEIQFTKSLNESPEMYLQRISAEVINQRENENINLKKRAETNRLNGNDIIEMVAKSGLLKDIILPENGNRNESTAENDRKWLYRVIIVLLLVLFMYFLLIQ